MQTIRVRALRGDFTLVETEDNVLLNVSQLLLPDCVREGDVVELQIKRNATAEK